MSPGGKLLLCGAMLLTLGNLALGGGAKFRASASGHDENGRPAPEQCRCGATAAETSGADADSRGGTPPDSNAKPQQNGRRRGIASYRRSECRAGDASTHHPTLNNSCGSTGSAYVGTEPADAAGRGTTTVTPVATAPNHGPPRSRIPATSRNGVASAPYPTDLPSRQQQQRRRGRTAPGAPANTASDAGASPPSPAQHPEHNQDCRARRPPTT